MRNRLFNSGMTLVELMCVVGIIGILAAIGANFIMGRQSVQAQKDFNNDIQALFQLQRSRAASMNVATYIRFEKNGTRITSVEPRIGDVAICSGTLTLELPIKYSMDGDNVAIDLQGPSRRALDSADSHKYITNGSSEGLLNVSVNVLSQEINASHQIGIKASSGLEAPNLTTICFQPNGQAVFFNGENRIQSGSIARFKICTSDGGTEARGFQVEVTSVGMIRQIESGSC